MKNPLIKTAVLVLALFLYLPSHGVCTWEGAVHEAIQKYHLEGKTILPPCYRESDCSFFRYILKGLQCSIVCDGDLCPNGIRMWYSYHHYKIAKDDGIEGLLRQYNARDHNDKGWFVEFCSQNNKRRLVYIPDDCY